MGKKRKSLGSLRAPLLQQPKKKKKKKQKPIKDINRLKSNGNPITPYKPPNHQSAPKVDIETTTSSLPNTSASPNTSISSFSSVPSNSPSISSTSSSSSTTTSSSSSSSSNPSNSHSSPPQQPSHKKQSQDNEPDEDPDEEEAAYIIIDPTTRQAGTGHAIAGDETRNVAKRGENLLAWLIAPLTVPNFMETYWENQPVLIQRPKSANYFDGWFSSTELFKMVEDGKLTYGVDLDVAKYTQGTRTTPSNNAPLVNTIATLETLNHAFLEEGHSIRLKCPQMHSNKLWKMIATMEDYLQYGGGCNVYLTPPNAQGFAPHYDDIEAFVLQLEGQKRWRVYKPTTEAELLPRYSSVDLEQHMVDKDYIVIDVILNPGDILYFPRGWVHQAIAEGDSPSLHLTVSTARQQSWFNFMKQHLLPQALEQAFEDNLDMRRSLPVGYTRYMGVMHENSAMEYAKGTATLQGGVSSSSSSIETNSTLIYPGKNATVLREEFIGQCVKIFDSMMYSLNFDRASDDAAQHFLHDRMPPVLSRKETRTSKQTDRIASNPMAQTSWVRILRPDIVRLTTCVDSVQVWHSAGNSRLWHENPPQGIEFELDTGPALEYIINQYPEYIKIGEDWGIWNSSGLQLSEHEKVQEQLMICRDLWDHGLICLKRGK